MKLTICLVTKGRERYIDGVLSSFLPFLEDEDVDIFLIDNGSDFNCREILANWQVAHSSSSRLFRFDNNDSRYSTIWPLILSANIDWIVMPGDDDQLRPEILLEWKAAVAANPNLSAFASSAAVMNEHGNFSDVVLQPTAGLSESKMEQVATAFHGPVFIWPSLFFRVTKVDPQVPSSRYAFDWWVGLNLLINGDIKTTSSIGINYRVHSGQETNLAPLRRKFFEGSMWLADFIESPSFLVWIEALTDKERILLWEALLRKKPIYGDVYFGRPLLLSLARTLMKTATDFDTKSGIALGLACLSGIFLKDGEVVSVISGSKPNLGVSQGNVTVDLAPNTCDPIVRASEVLMGEETAQKFGVYCKHSKKKVGYVFINCDKLVQDSLATNADIVIEAITDYCENRNDFDRAISSSERRTLLVLRSFQTRMPLKLKIILRWVRNSRLVAK